MTTSITVISEEAVDLIGGDDDRCRNRYRASSLGALRRILEQLKSSVATRLDLVGHSTRDAHLLCIGKTVVDMSDVRVSQFFEKLVDDLVPPLKIAAVRLLGCQTAVEPSGQRTMRALARTMRVPVFGSRKMILKSYYNEAGFDPAFASILIESAELPNPPRRLA